MSFRESLKSLVSDAHLFQYVEVNSTASNIEKNRPRYYFTKIQWGILERPLYFDPFGQVEFAPVGHNIIAPCKVLVQGSILFYPFRDSGFS